MYKYIKRILDLFLSIIILVVLFIPMIIISIIIKIDSKGSAFFKQKRSGLNGKIFIMYKFRTMHKDNDVRDFKNNDKHTKVGTLLRRSSLDELPQIINIFKGEMSFIGPRPWIPEYYENMNKKQRHRCDVLPGITGLAQCKGRNTISIFKKINYDLEYVKNFSFIEDLKIVCLTIMAVFKKQGSDAGKSVIQNELEELKKQD